MKTLFVSIALIALLWTGGGTSLKTSLPGGPILGEVLPDIQYITIEHGHLSAQLQHAPISPGSFSGLISSTHHILDDGQGGLTTDLMSDFGPPSAYDGVGTIDYETGVIEMDFGLIVHGDVVADYTMVEAGRFIYHSFSPDF